MSRRAPATRSADRGDVSISKRGSVIAVAVVVAMLLGLVALAGVIALTATLL